MVFEMHTEVKWFLKEGNVELACGLGRKISHLADVVHGFGKHKAGQVHLGEN